MDNILLLSILLVFLAAIMGSFVQRWRKDRVLSDLQGFHATLRLQGGKRVWGRMNVFPNGLELVFARPYLNRRDLKLYSYILFKQSIDDVEAIFRYHDELSPENQSLREDEVKKTANNGWFRRLVRRIRNFINTFRDAINESLGLFLTRMKGTSGSVLMKTQDERIKKLGSQAVGAVGNAYDPILERYVGKYAVIELLAGERVEEFSGVLREYSQSWISLFGCHLREKLTLPVDDPMRLLLQRQMDFALTLRESGDAEAGLLLEIEIQNYSVSPVSVKYVEGDDYQREMNQMLLEGETRRWVLDDVPATLMDKVDRHLLPLELRLVAPERLTGPRDEERFRQTIEQLQLPALAIVFELEREADGVFPRTLATLRHGGEYL